MTTTKEPAIGMEEATCTIAAGSTGPASASAGGVSETALASDAGVYNTSAGNPSTSTTTNTTTTCSSTASCDVVHDLMTKRAELEAAAYQYQSPCSNSNLTSVAVENTGTCPKTKNGNDKDYNYKDKDSTKAVHEGTRTDTDTKAKSATATDAALTIAAGAMVEPDEANGGGGKAPVGNKNNKGNTDGKSTFQQSCDKKTSTNTGTCTQDFDIMDVVAERATLATAQKSEEHLDIAETTTTTTTSKQATNKRSTGPMATRQHHHPAATAGLLPPPTLSREMNLRPDTRPGAVSISNPMATTSSHPPRMANGAEMISLAVHNDLPLPPQEQSGSFDSDFQSASKVESQEIYLSAELVVNDSSGGGDRRRYYYHPHPDLELVPAEPAHEGFQALIHNTYFKPVAGAVCLVLILAITIPLAITLRPKPTANNNNNLSTNSTTTIITQDQLCGKRHEHQANYRGQISVTELGIECMRWDAQFPHQHDPYTQGEMEEHDLKNNYCRNPCGDCEPRAWCYTVDPNVTWAYCNVPFCQTDNDFEVNTECGHAEVGWTDYRGNISVSAAGNTCKRWDELDSSNLPKFPPSEILEENVSPSHGCFRSDSQC